MQANHPLLPSLVSGAQGKIVSAREAVRLVRDGDTIAFSGLVGIGFPEAVALALRDRFLGDDELQPKPRDLHGNREAK